MPLTLHRMLYTFSCTAATYTRTRAHTHTHTHTHTSSPYFGCVTLSILINLQKTNVKYVAMYFSSHITTMACRHPSVLLHPSSKCNMLPIMQVSKPFYYFVFSLLASLSSCPSSKAFSIYILPLTLPIHMQQHAHLQFTTFTSLHFYTAVNKTEHSEAVSMSAKFHLLLLSSYILCTTMNSFCTQNQ